MIDSLVLLPLFADAGIPMIMLTLPAMLMLLIPIIVAEGFLCKRWLGLTTWEAMKCITVSNLASTIIGIPVAWAVMLAVEVGVMGTVADRIESIHGWYSPLANVVFFILGSAWIGPSEGSYAWFIPAATLALLVPFFFASYGVEYLVLKFMVGMPEGGPPNLSYPRVRKAVRNANLITYGALFAATAVWLVISWPRH